MKSILLKILNMIDNARPKTKRWLKVIATIIILGIIAFLIVFFTGERDVKYKDFEYKSKAVKIK